MQQRLTPDQAWPKIKHYCAYQERSHQDVKEKLYGFGLYKTDVDQLLSRLIEEDYLNETRFAQQFAGGHFRMKRWGKVKIVYELKQRQVSAYNIKAALKTIPEEDYLATLEKLATDKWRLLKGEHYMTRQAKANSYLRQKGYEPELVQQMIKKLKEDVEEE